MERKLKFTGEDENMLSGFRLVYLELYRDDLEPSHREYVEESLFEIAKCCVDRGMGLELQRIKDDVDTEQKLIKLKNAYNDGEIAL